MASADHGAEKPKPLALLTGPGTPVRWGLGLNTHMAHGGVPGQRHHGSFGLGDESATDRSNGTYESESDSRPDSFRPTKPQPFKFQTEERARTRDRDIPVNHGKKASARQQREREREHEREQGHRRNLSASAGAAVPSRRSASAHHDLSASAGAGPSSVGGEAPSKRSSRKNATEALFAKRGLPFAFHGERGGPASWGGEEATLNMRMIDEGKANANEGPYLPAPPGAVAPPLQLHRPQRRASHSSGISLDHSVQATVHDASGMISPITPVASQMAGHSGRNSASVPPTSGHTKPRQSMSPYGYGYPAISPKDAEFARGGGSKPKRSNQRRSKSHAPEDDGTGVIFSSPRRLPSNPRFLGQGDKGPVKQRVDEYAACLADVRREVLLNAPEIKWDDIAGLTDTKRILQEVAIFPSLRPDIFKGLRAPSRGVLLFGPPGTGKTMLAKAVATESQATFFSVSAAALTSKYVGRGEKMVRALFQVAGEYQPSIIFIDEMDSVLSSRSEREHEASKRLKTEFLLRFDGVEKSADRMIVIGATNRPADLDDAVRRRMTQRVYVPLPDAMTRRALLSVTLNREPNELAEEQLDKIANMCEGYSGSDMSQLCKEAAMGAIRELKPDQIRRVDAASIRPIQYRDFELAMANIKPSVSTTVLREFEDWNQKFGSNLRSS